MWTEAPSLGPSLPGFVLSADSRSLSDGRSPGGGSHLPVTNVTFWEGSAVCSQGRVRQLAPHTEKSR